MAKTEPFEKYVDDYELWFEQNKYVYKSEIKAIQSLINKQDEGVEIGVGSGLFASELGIEYGLEPAEAMRTLAEERGIETISGVAEKLPYDDNSFDYALMVTTVCFLDDMEKSFKEVKRIIKSSGYFVVAFVDKSSNLGKKYQRFKVKNKFYKHATFYSTDQIQSVLIKTGFKIKRVIQTVFGDLDQIVHQQNFEKGYGKGGFVAIKAVNS